MTLPPVVRIFFAIALAAEVKYRMGEWIADLKKESRSHGIRWTKPDNLHITLQFLPEVRTKDIESMINNVKKSIKQGSAYPAIHLGALQLFPYPFRPRMIVLEVLPVDGLQALARLVGEGIEATGYEIEKRIYRPHLSVGRIKYTQGVSLDFLSSTMRPSIEEMAINEVTLFRSEPEPQGSHYTVLERIVYE